MTTNEFSIEFDTLLQPFIGTYKDLAFDEYEKSVFLTEAQEQIILQLYENLEQSEENRKYLSNLIKTYSVTPVQETDGKLLNINNYKSYKINIDDNILFIIYEQCTLGDDAKCFKGRTISIQPIIHDEVSKVLQNPFRCPNERRVIRLDIDGKIELISKYSITEYKARYLKKPSPIVLTNLEDNSIDGYNEVNQSEVNSILHDRILRLAVQLAIQSKVKNNNAQ